ncbi:clathrin coat assembly protein AP180 [Genypterus blacodes]|uniref:clathrin coat assembly protein AP180 n=1 Tax=Genypterus blacodes TaxID=154954 RepID=UPI003F764DF3
MSGQTLTDRIAAAQYTLTGSDVARVVCKSTTHEQTAPKKKHLEYLIQATQETNVNIPQMADTLFERAGNASWVVVFKALITTHNLMVNGNERFLQFLASRNTLFNLSNFLDKTGSHGYDMSTFIRRYSRYLNEKAFAYRQMAFDFGRVKKGAEGVMRTMSVEKLLKGMPTLQSQIDALLDFEVHQKDLNNHVINACFLLLFKDLIKLYACYNDGIINLLEKFFQMKRSQCKDGLEIYKRFLTRMTRVSEFFKIAEQVGIDKNDIPELTQAPESLLESLETHLNTLEGKKPEDKSPTKDATANSSSPAPAPAPAPTPAPAPAAPVKAAAPARPGPPAKRPPPPVTPTRPPSIATATASNALDDGFLLDLDPMASSSVGGAAAASSTTGWGDLLAGATPPTADAASKGDSFATASAAPALPVPTGATAAAAAAAPAATAAASALLPIPGPAATSAAEMDLFGDAFAPSPGDGPAAMAAGPATDAFGGSDPFATTEGSADIAAGLDLFAMRPAATGAPAAAATATTTTAITPPTSNEAPTIAAPIAAPAAPTPSSTTTTTTTTDTTTTTTESAAAPTLDIFGDMFDSMPEQSPTTESKAATTPSVDLFGADLPAVSRGPSPLPEPIPTGDIMSDSFSSPGAAADSASSPSPEASTPPKAEPAPVIDLLDSFGSPGEETQISAPGAPADDLLGGLMSPTLAPTTAPALAPALALSPAPAPMHNDLLESNFDSLDSLPSPTPPVPAAVPSAPIVPAAAAPLEPVTASPAPSGGFDASMFDGLGDLLMPAITPQSTGGSTAGSTAGSMGTPVTGGGIAAAPPAAKTISGDLDSSLANLIGDLGVKKKDPQSEKKLTGGANWMPKVAPTSWGTPGAPMSGAAPGATAAPAVRAMVPPIGAQSGFGMPPAAGPGAPMMQSMMGQSMMGQSMMRPAFPGVAGAAAPGAAAPGAPVSPGPANQSPKKPKDPLAELDLKDFL